MFVSEINRYPLKSGAAESLTVGEMKFTGLEYDRHWMVVSQSGQMISQRERGAQKLALVYAVLLEAEVEFVAPGQPSLVIPIENPGGIRRTVEVHGNSYQGIDAGDEAAEWISQYLPAWKEESFRIVYFPGDFRRNILDDYTQAPSAETQFADGYAALITNEASLRDLNQRLHAKGVDLVNMKVFRPNIVINDERPFIEDHLRKIQIGDAILEIVKPCARCPITGVTQESGEFSEKPNEPRATLAEYHRGDHLSELYPQLDEKLRRSAMFGMNAIVLKEGTIRVDDQIKIVS